MSRHATRRGSLEHLAVHLLRRAGQRADEIFAEELADANVTPRQYAVLVSVAQNADPSQADLVKKTGIDRSTMGDLVRSLVKKGLVQRQRSRRNPRAYAVRLTETGNEALKMAEPQALRADAAIVARLSREQRKSFIEALNIISGS